MSSIREYEEREFLETLRNAIPDKPLSKRVESVYGRRLDDIERAEVELRRAFQAVPEMLQKVSELSGIDQNTLVTIIYQSSSFNQDIPFERLLRIIQDFFVIKQRIERQDQERKP